jgi:DNA-binding GntR family transcriptional regulator
MWIREQDFNKRELARLAADTDRAIGDVYEFREVVETAAARLAAERAKTKDVRKLRNLVEAMQSILAAHLKNPAVSANVARFLALDSQFHIEIARVAGNPFISEAVERSLAERYAPFGAVFRVLHADANKGHGELIDAIAAGDAVRAETEMRAHVSGARTTLISILSRHIRAQNSY